MRALSQTPGTPRGARPHSRAHACASRGLPACACQSRSGACARYLRRTGVAGFPQLQAPFPPHLAPPLPPRRPLFAEWGWLCSGSRALDPARSGSRAVNDCPARAASRSLSVSGAQGSVKRRRRRFLFPFLALPPVGSSILHSASLPLPQRGPAAAEGCEGGGRGRRRPPLRPPRVRAWGAGPLHLAVWRWASAGAEGARWLRLGLALLFLLGRPPRACCCNCCCCSGKSGEGAPGTFGRVPL